MYNHIPAFIYNNKIREVVSKSKYLGIMLNSIKRYNEELFKEIGIFKLTSYQSCA